MSDVLEVLDTVIDMMELQITGLGITVSIFAVLMFVILASLLMLILGRALK